MKTPPEQLANLLGSRLCHDLISPIGAVCNGVELMSMGPGRDLPEVAMISESIENANYKIQFYRVAYGLASAEQTLDVTEIRRILAGLTKGGRLRIDWTPETTPSRTVVKLAFLLIQCAESALPFGGKLRVTQDTSGWGIQAEGKKINPDPVLFAALSTPDSALNLTPAQVHFALAAWAAHDAGRTISMLSNATGLALRF